MPPITKLRRLRGSAKEERDMLGLGSDLRTFVDLIEETDSFLRGFAVTPDAFSEYIFQNDIDELMREAGLTGEVSLKRYTDGIERVHSQIFRGELPESHRQEIEDELERLRTDELHLIHQGTRGLTKERKRVSSIEEIEKEFKRHWRDMLPNSSEINRWEGGSILRYCSLAESIVVTESPPMLLGGSFEAHYYDGREESAVPEEISICATRKRMDTSWTDVYTVDYETGDITDVHVGSPPGEKNNEQDTSPLLTGPQADALIDLATKIFGPQANHDRVWAEWELVHGQSESQYRSRLRPVLRVPPSRDWEGRRRHPFGRSKMSSETVADGTRMGAGISEGEVRVVETTDREDIFELSEEATGSILVIKEEEGTLPPVSRSKLLEEAEGILTPGEVSLTSSLAILARDTETPALMDCDLSDVEEGDNVVLDGGRAKVYSA